MKAVCFLLALIGSVCALQYPVEYEYQYEGRLATGIPSIRPQVASVGIKAKLILQMKAKSQGLAQLTNVEVGEFNDDVDCMELRGPVPFRWSRMPNPYRRHLEEPFAIYFQEDMGHVMKVSRKEEEFITNIRKSVVELLRLEPVVANLGGVKGDSMAKYISGGKAPDAFTIEEESIFGRCESEYSLVRIPSNMELDEMKEIKTTMEVDEQTTKSPRTGSSNVPKLQDQYWRLVRAINFDKCHDRVILQSTGFGNMSHAGYSQFRSTQSRSSVGTYILKGSPGAFRVDSAIVEGDIAANPFGYKSYRMQTITNQTLILKKATNIQTAMQLPSLSRTVKTWRYEVASPFAPPHGSPKPWVNYSKKGDKYSPVMPETTYLGMSSSASEIKEYKKSFEEMLKSAVEEIYSDPSAPRSDKPSWQSTQSSKAATHLHFMSRVIRALPLESVREIFSSVFSSQDVESQRKQIVLVDVAVASGASAPIKVLVDHMKQSKLSPQRIGSVFATIANNLWAPSVVPDLMEYVKSLDFEKNPILASSAHVNFASLAERVCLNYKKFNYSVPNPVFGEESCKPSLILSNFLPYLKQKAKNAPTSWERAAILQTVANLGTPQVLPVLRPYVFGHLDSNPRVRMVAIYGLTRRRLPDSTREIVFDTLMTIIDSLEEKPEIRQTALVSLLTWHPDTAWWQRMARSTWREPSQSMAAFITFTVESLAKSTEPYLHRQASIAAFVLPLLKPYSPSVKYSYSQIFSRYDPVSKIGVNSHSHWLESAHDAIPSEIYHSLRENFGDVNYHLYEISFASANLSRSMFDLISSIKYPSTGNRNTPSNTRDPSSRNYEFEFEGYSEPSSEGDREANIYIRAYENMYQYLPLNKDVIAKIAGKDGQHFLKKLVEGYKVNMTKFYDPVNIEYFIPTEIGLPLIGSVAMPTMNLGDSEVRLDVPDLQNPRISDLLEARNVSLLFKSNYKYMSKLLVRMQVPMPWERKFVECVVENFNEVNLPIYGNLTFGHTEEIKNLTFNVAPYTQEEFSVVYSHNIPATQIRDYIPDAQMRSNYKVVGVEKNRQPALKVQKEFDQKYTGIQLSLKYNADAAYPFTSAMFWDYLRKPESLGKLMISPTTKQWQYYLTSKSQRSLPSNVSISLSYVTPRPQESQQSVPDFSAKDDQSSRLDKFRSFSEGSQVYGINAQLFFNSSDFRRYEAVFALTKKGRDEGDYRSYKSVGAVLADRVPHYTDSPKALCSSSQFKTPAISDFDAMKRLLQSSSLEEKIDSKIYFGESCSSSTIASVQGSVSVSSERLQLIQDEVNKICNYDPKNPVVELQTPAVYDQMRLQVDFQQDQIPQSLVNASYHAQQLLEGCLFPHVYQDNMHEGSSGKIHVDARRPLSSDRYTFWADMPQKHSIYSEIYIPYAVTRIVPWSGLKTTFDRNSNLLIAPMQPDTCHIQDKSIKTYDSLDIDYKPNPCWATTTFDSRDRSRFVVNTRKNLEERYEAEIKMPKDKSVVLITRNNAIINGRVMPKDQKSQNVLNSKGQTIMKVKRDEDYFTVSVIGYLTVRVKDDIQITPESSVKGYLSGICGDFDGSPSKDMTGPKKCFYTNSQLFVYSWTKAEGTHCNKREVKEMHEKVREYQEKCPHSQTFKSSLALKSLYEKKTSNCYMIVYPVTHPGNIYCAAIQSMRRCQAPCKMVSSKTKRVPAKCWGKKDAPDEVVAAAEVGYMMHPPTEPSSIRGEIEQQSATDCRKPGQ